jgi:hypothetical protein
MAIPCVVLCVLVASASALQAAWIENGLPVCTSAGLQAVPVVASDGAGGAIIAWFEIVGDDYRWDVYAQRVDSSGSVRWATAGVPICTEGHSLRSLEIVSDGIGGALIFWHDGRNGYPSYTYGQRIDASGVVQWQTNGIAVTVGSYPVAVSDGSGGAIIAVKRPVVYESAIYAQRVSASGEILWAPDGVGICAAAEYQGLPYITMDGAGGAIIAWNESRLDAYADIYAQRVDASGVVQWMTDGVVICAAFGYQEYLQLVSDDAGGAIIAWCDSRSLVPYDIYAQRVNASGSVQWMTDGVAVCVATGRQWFPVVASDGSHGAIITWQDERNGNEDLYAQRLDASGAVRWGADGVAVCAEPGRQIGPAGIVSDDAGGAIIEWCDYRGGSNWDIYAQRVNASGAALWAAAGVAICSAAGDQFPSVTDQLIADGLGGAITAWKDKRSGEFDIYAQIVRANGTAGDRPVATLLKDFFACALDRAVSVSWNLSEARENAGFSVLRSCRASYYVKIDPAVSGEGFSFSFVDAAVEPGESYRYRVDISTGGSTRCLFETDRVTVPAASFILHQNYPNPCNPSTTVSYYIPAAGMVTLEIFDVSGRLIAGLVNEVQERGEHSAVWSGMDMNANPVSSGMYFYRLSSGKAVLSRKLSLLR